MRAGFWVFLSHTGRGAPEPSKTMGHGVTDYERIRSYIFDFAPWLSRKISCWQHSPRLKLVAPLVISSWQERLPRSRRPWRLRAHGVFPYSYLAAAAIWSSQIPDGPAWC